MGWNLKEVQKAHEDFKRELRETVQAALSQAGNRAAELASQTDAFGGTRLKNSVRYRFLSAFTLRVHTGLKHASFMNDGTPPHIIRARRKKSLRFVKDGEVVFARKVNHPGTKATHWLDDATDGAFRDMSRELETNLEDLSRRFQ